MLDMSWITAVLQLYSQVAVRFGNVIIKRINKRLFDLLARFHYILNLPRILHAILIMRKQQILLVYKVTNILEPAEKRETNM